MLATVHQIQDRPAEATRYPALGAFLALDLNLSPDEASWILRDLPAQDISAIRSAMETAGTTREAKQPCPA